MEKTIKHLELMLKIRQEQCEIVKLAGGWCSTCKDDIEALQDAIRILKELENLNQLEKVVD